MFYCIFINKFFLFNSPGEGFCSNPLHPTAFIIKCWVAMFVDWKHTLERFNSIKHTFLLWSFILPIDFRTHPIILLKKYFFRSSSRKKLLSSSYCILFLISDWKFYSFHSNELKVDNFNSLSKLIFLKEFKFQKTGLF